MKTRLLITGASGQLGGYLLRQASRLGIEAIGWSSRQPGKLFGIAVRPVDLADPDRLAHAFREYAPTSVIHAAAKSNIDGCYNDPQLAEIVNVQGTKRLTELAAEQNAKLLFVSTDLVFDGEDGNYDEAAAPSPLSVYARTKVAAEKVVLPCPDSLVTRVSLLFGPTLVGRPSFFDKQCKALRDGQPCRLFEDEWRTPLSLQTAAEALIELARSETNGLLHVGGPERMSRLEMGQRLAKTLNADQRVIQSTRRAEIDFPEPRPRDTSLDSSRWRQLKPDSDWPLWDEALKKMTNDEIPREENDE